MTSKKKLLYLSLIALFPGLTGCSIADTANAAKSKIVNVSKKDTKKVKERKVSGSKPNIVIIITVDQVYGDLGCSGSPIIKTPHTDKLANELVWLTDYHVAPTCSPTRAVLMSGHWTNRTGVWHTIMGRSMLRARGDTGPIFQGKRIRDRNVW